MATPYLPTEQAVAQSSPEILGLERQRKLADLLTAQAFAQPQGQMISGHYVAPSWTQQLAPMASLLAGGAISERADKKQEELATALRGKKAIENKAISEAITQKDWNKAAELISLSDTGAGKEYLPLIAKYLVPEQMKPQVVSPGGALVDASGKLIYQAPYKPLAGDGLGIGGIDGEGRFNKKGDYITPSGTPIFKSEVIKDREIIKTADELRKGLGEITSEDVKKSATILGDVSQPGLKSYIAKQLGNKAVSAQNKINASAVMQTLQNLPPGPASDKDISNAKSTFPGYGDEEALNDWIKNTKAMLDRKINLTNQKYGSENWYGAQNVSPTSASAVGTDLQAAAAAELAKRQGKK